MSTFTGTKHEFRRFIGPRLRNLVQMLTRKHKATVAACEYCGAAEHLESAHIHGRDRNQIIDILLETPTSGQVVTVDLRQFEVMFRAEHDPIEKAILILCRQCHSKYDSGAQRTANGVALILGTGISAAQGNSADMLPITLEPPQVTEFKSQLLIHRRAEIRTYFNDGRIERRLWDASRFAESSTVMGNLRSRPEFRQGKWQSAGIVKVHVCIIGSDT